MTESPYSDSLSLRLPTFIVVNLATPNNSPAHYAKGTRSGIDLAAHSPLTACKRTVSGSFHSPPGVLFTFPSRYWFTIGRQGVFSLARWSSQIPTGFLVSRGTQVPVQRDSESFAYGAFTLCGQSFQDCSTTLLFCNSSASRPDRPYNPAVHARRFGLVRVRSPLLAESLFVFSSSGY